MVLDVGALYVSTQGSMSLQGMARNGHNKGSAVATEFGHDEGTLSR